jgi:hypothetical protein
MTDTEITYTPGELGFSHPLDYHLVSVATPYVVENLNQLMMTHSDEETRWADSRRTHPGLGSSIWFAFYRNNNVVITNRLGYPADQFRYLLKGNGVGQICAKHQSHYLSKDGTVKSKPGVLKFYDKRDGMWKYRHCVSVIHQDVIDTFNSGMKRAVFQGLEQARWEIGQERDITPGIFTVSESSAATASVGTSEEVHLEMQGAIKTEKMDEQIKNEQASIFARLMSASEKAYKRAMKGGSSLLGRFRRR